ncbi:MAG: DUF1178 family protein [Acetobacteraceae bacterium]|nr:DUF1178 family protein [Acetobacteraceae bacterium]
MMHYQVRCRQGHEFDGWFKDSAAFENQVSLGFLECPTCGDKQVTRALMAPALVTRSQVPIQASSPPPAPAPQPPAASGAGAVAGPIPDHLRAMLQRLRTEVEKNCDYVGPQFAEEARRMHRGESDRRGIYGETSAEEAEALNEEGISFGRIPWVPRAES